MRAIIFDFDGVIVDSEPAHEAGLRAAFAEIGIELSHEEFVAKCLGKGDRPCMAAVAADRGRTLTPRELDAMMEHKGRVFLGLVESGQVRSYEGTLALIRAAAERCPVAVCSGSGRLSVEPVLRKLDLLNFLGAIVTADDVTRTKPDPAPYLLAASRLAVAPERCVAIEDTPTGVRSARAAGCEVIGVAHTVPASALAEAHRVVPGTADLSIEELLRAL